MDLVPAGFRGEGQGQCPSRLQQQRHSDALLLSAVGKLHDARDSCLQYITSRHSSVDSSRVTLVVFDGWTLLSFSLAWPGCSRPSMFPVSTVCTNLCSLRGCYAVSARGTAAAASGGASERTAVQHFVFDYQTECWRPQLHHGCNGGSHSAQSPCVRADFVCFATHCNCNCKEKIHRVRGSTMSTDSFFSMMMIVLN